MSDETEKTMREAAYIGVTGVTSGSDVSIINSGIGLLPPTHRLMAGVLASAKTLRGEATTNRRYPRFGDVEPLLSSLASTGAWPTVHFNCREGLGEHLARLAGELPSMRGLQLNAVRPDPDAIERFLTARPDVEFILQVNRGIAPPGTTITARHVADYVARYAGIASHALVDLSGGEGRGLSVDLAATSLLAWESHWHIRPALAGGLGPASAVPLRLLAYEASGSRHPLSDVSLDAESGLRVPCADPIAGEPHQDELDGDKTRRWVALAALACGASVRLPS